MIVVLLQEWKLWEAYINSCSQSTVNSTDEGILETGNIFQCHDSWDTSVLVERLIARTYDSVGPATSLETGQRYVYLPLSGFLSVERLLTSGVAAVFRSIHGATVLAFRPAWLS